ncbi:MAG: GAF domain-containing protein [Phormidesmis sp. RL_2_1]|nr:GAF domain-containing protein [Phormidesmis sp. RL_2_1]
MSHLINNDEQFNALQQAAEQLSSCAGQISLQIRQQQALTSSINRIRASSDIQTIFKTAATEIRELLAADRVGVFRFTLGSGWDEGEFVAEDVALNFPSAMATKVHDHCFGSQFAAHYCEGRIQAVADIYQAGLSDCHIRVLEQFQVRANLIVPVLKGDELWGLLCIHQCAHSRYWQMTEIEFAKKIAGHFAIALQQAQYLEQLQAQVAQLDKAKAQEKALFKITNRIRQSLGWEAICETATAEVRQLLAVDRVAVYRFNADWSGDFVFESVTDEWKPLVGVTTTIKDTHLMESERERYANNEFFAIADIYEAGYADCHVALLEEFQARAHVIVPIFQSDRLWGLLAAFQNSGPRQWQDDEIKLLTQISEQLGIALQQAEAVWKIHAQSVALEQTLEELKQSQMQMVQNEKMASLGQLVAGVAHEINNPINFIHGNLTHINRYITDLLSLISAYQQHAPGSPEGMAAFQQKAEEIDVDFITEDLPKTLASMNTGTERIRHIVLSLRNFSRLDESDFKTVDIHQGLDSTLLILGGRIKACSDRYQFEIVKNYGHLPLIECYPAQLNQVFMNLLTNALDAIEEAVEKAAEQKNKLTKIQESLKHTKSGSPPKSINQTTLKSAFETMALASAKNSAPKYSITSLQQSQ